MATEISKLRVYINESEKINNLSSNRSVREIDIARAVTYWLTGSALAAGMLKPGDNDFGYSAQRVHVATLKAGFLLGLQYYLNFCAITIINSGYNATIISNENIRINKFVQGLIDSALGLESFAPAGASYINFVYSGGQFYVETKVSTI